MPEKLTPNYNVRCTVANCANHCPSEEYCGLDSICIGSHEPHPDTGECTDCQSFVKK